MPPVYVPGVIQANISGVTGAQPWTTIVHWRDGVSTSAPSFALCQALADAVYTNWNAQLVPVCGTNVIFKRCDTFDMSSATGAVAQHVQDSLAGSYGNPLDPASLCAVVKYPIAARYRGGHPRGYWPFGAAAGMATESTWSAGTITLIQTKMQAFFAALATALTTAGMVSPNHCVPRYTYSYTNDPVHHKYLKEKTGLASVNSVQPPYICRAVVGTQRRRLIV